jgi:hypothetical protein
MAAPVVFGAATIMANLCAAEVAAHWVFGMGEPNLNYKFDVLGFAIGRPSKIEALRWVVKYLEK